MAKISDRTKLTRIGVCGIIALGALMSGFSPSALSAEEIWTWIPSSTPIDAPPQRFGAAMAYDEARERVLLFGGQGPGVPGAVLNDTWQWNGKAQSPSWTKLTLNVNPPGRVGASVAYDTTRQRIVLFGGSDSSGQVLNDTWEWNGTSWSNVTPATGQSPPSRREASMAFDGDNVMLFGGRDGVQSFGDTWTWNGTTWTNRLVQGPPARYLAAMAYHPLRDKVLLFSGNFGTPEIPGPPITHDAGYDSTGYYPDHWTWNGSTWANRPTLPEFTPYQRSGASMAYDPATQRIFLFGGLLRPRNGMTPGPHFETNDTWAWDGNWKALNRTNSIGSFPENVSATSPTPRQKHSLAYDGVDPLLFGGYSASSLTTLNDTWSYREPDPALASSLSTASSPGF